MQQQNLPPFRTPPAKVESTDFETLMTEIADLRSSIINAWQERAISFTRTQQHMLKAEIDATTSLLDGLTLNA